MTRRRALIGFTEAELISAALGTAASSITTITRP